MRKSPEATGGRTRKTRPAPADRKSRIRLTRAQCELPVGELMAVLRERGHAVSKSTVRRARIQGWFMPSSYRRSTKLPGRKLELTEEEQRLPTVSVERRFNTSVPRSAKRRGYIVVNSVNRGRVKTPKDRALDNDLRLLASLPARIEEAPDGTRVARMSPQEVHEVFGISVRKSYDICERGYISTWTWSLEQRLKVARRIEELQALQRRRRQR